MSSSNVSYAYLIGKESTRGTSVTADKDIGVITNLPTTPTRESIICAGIGSIEQEANKSGLQLGNQSVTMNFQHGRIFDFIVGEASHVETTSDWVHTFAVDNLPPTFTAEFGSNLSGGDVGMKSVLNVIESAELSMEINGLLQLSFSTKSVYPVALDTVPAHVVLDSTCFPHGTVTLNINSALAASIQSVSISFEKVAEDVAGIDSVDVSDIIPVELRVKFSIEAAFDDSTYRDHGLDNDIISINLVADNGVALGSGKRGLDLDLDNVIVSGGPEEVANVSGLTFITLSGEAKINTFTTTDGISSANWF